MRYKPTISTACSMLMTFKYILLLTLTIWATPLLPCGSVLSIFPHGAPETCLKAILERPKELHFRSRFMKQPSFGDSIIFAGTEINITKKARNLGVIMDNNLSFSSHVNEIRKKSTLAIRSIGRIRKYLSLDGVKMLVNTFVILRSDYCNCLLHGIPKYQRDKLQRIQNTTARLVMGLKRPDHVTLN